MKYVRKSIITKQDIAKGSIIDDKMIVIKRPATGLNPVDIHRIIGKRAKIHIAKDEILNLNMVE